jgi:D-aminoacyl-tRNA deacylase
MRALIQRVRSASVEVDGITTGAIENGLLVLLGITHDDDDEIARRLAEKVAGLRIFSDGEGKFNLSLLDVRGDALVVSQFTLFADTRKGKRPSFTQAAPPEVAEELVTRFCAHLRALGPRVDTGVFGARMLVSLANDGPVTIMLDSDDWQRPRRGSATNE